MTQICSLPPIGESKCYDRGGKECPKERIPGPKKNTWPKFVGTAKAS